MQTTGTPPTNRWRALWRAYPKTVVVLLTVVVGAIVANGVMFAKVWRYRSETDRLRAGMSDAERQRTDVVLSSEQHRLRVMLELVRRQARGDRELHLAVAVDSGRMYLEREGIVLRSMQVRVGAERLVGQAPDTVRLATPRGARTVERLLTAKDRWEVPAWVFLERGLPVPPDRNVEGALGSVGVLLSGGALLYATPASGPLADANFVLPGSILLSEADLRAIAPNLAAGMSVYFY